MGAKGTFRLKPLGAYNFDLSYSFYRRSKFEMVDRFADRLFIRPVLIDDTPVLIKIANGTGGLVNMLKIDWESPASEVDTGYLRRLLIRMLYLDFDIDDFYGHSKDNVMRGLIGQFTGFRPILTPNVFEAAAWAIIGQQVNLQFAYRLKSRLVEYVKRTFSISGQTYHLFPTAAEIAGIDYHALRSMQFSGRKAEYLLDLARMVATGDLDLEGMIDLAYEPALEKLLAIRGLGPWSANYILMRGAGHRDAFPVGDSGINHAVNELYGLGKKPDIGRLLELGEQWRPYRSLATFYLWKSL